MWMHKSGTAGNCLIGMSIAWFESHIILNAIQLVHCATGKLTLIEPLLGLVWTGRVNTSDSIPSD